MIAPAATVLSEFLQKRIAGEYDGPLAFCYGRMSHDDEFLSCQIKVQEERTVRYYEMQIRETGVQFGGFFGEKDRRSAWSLPLFKRPAGSQIFKHLRPGDHVIFDTIDRAWRHDTDYCLCRDYFLRQDIKGHTVNFYGASFDWESIAGRFFAGMMILRANMESEITSDRTKRGLQARRDAGRFPHHNPPPGTRIVKSTFHGKPANKLLWDTERIAVFDRLLELRAGGMRPQQIADLLNQEAHTGPLPWKRSAFNNDYWSKLRVARYIKLRLLLAKLGYPDTDPNTIDWPKIRRSKKKKRQMATPELLQ